MTYHLNQEFNGTSVNGSRVKGVVSAGGETAIETEETAIIIE